MTRTSIEKIADRLHSAAIHLLRRLRKVDTAAGISPARLSALSVLIFGGPRTLGELATTEQVTAPTMSRLVAGMERDGLVLRKPDPDDKRAVRLRPSARGRRTFERARRERLDLLTRLIAGCDDDERELLAAAAELIDRLAKKQL